MLYPADRPDQMYAVKTPGRFVNVPSASPFFKTVRIAPQPSVLKAIKSKTPCPQGTVDTDLRFDGGKVTGTVTLPAGLTGEFVWQGKTQPLKAGENEIR